MHFSGLISSNLGVAIISLLAGALITAVGTKIRGKRARLRYSTRTDRLALSADDPVFGAVRVTWGGQAVRNLHLVSIEVENTSRRDFESVDFKIYTDPATNLLNEHTGVAGAPYIVPWAASFQAAMLVPQGAAPTQSQLDTYYHSREYTVPVLNRGDLLQFNYLCTKPNDDGQPSVFVGTQLKGAKLKLEARSNLLYGVPLQYALTRGLTVSAFVVLLCGLLLRSVWAVGIICMAAGLCANLLGWLVYKIERWLRDLISG